MKKKRSYSLWITASPEQKFEATRVQWVKPDIDTDLQPRTPKFTPSVRHLYMSVFLSFFVFVLEPHTMMFRSYPWLGARELLLVMFRGPSGTRD